MVENKAPWRKTPLDEWSENVDPSIMVGDEWVDEGDPGVSQAVTEENAEDLMARSMRGRFMHPQHDVSMRDE